MKFLFNLIFKYNIFKLIIALIVLPLSIAFYLYLADYEKSDMIHAIENYVTFLREDLDENAYRALKEGRNLDAMKKLTYNRGTTRAYGHDYNIVHFLNYGANYYFSYYHQGGEKRIGQNISALDHTVEDIFTDAGYSIRVKTVDCSSTPFFSVRKPCIDQTFKVY